MADPVAADAAEEPQAEQVPAQRLPDEILLEVLQHLDVKSRLCFRLVSRRWNHLALKTLTSLTVYVRNIKDDKRFVAPLRKLFRGASRLKQVRLSHSSSSRMLNLVKCLVGHPSSSLTSLRVDGLLNTSKLCSNVAAALPELPALQELHLELIDSTNIGGPHPSLSSRQALMQAIRPHSTPHLSRLFVMFFSYSWGFAKDDKHCLHNWLHSESVQEMLAANRGLRLTVTNHLMCRPRGNCCEFCLLGCHDSPNNQYPQDYVEKSYEFSYFDFRCSNV
ncbi:uncharacterized protein LOC127749041 isoform X2 [Frankliniella occidentalis]|uniref:Uncharacterized protein LOC127749041 isoform X2 n=1 Tax=Frankliniella occidentalis TaxID=133901 RepID=A0A9C6TWI4_FRAOC|nr:uncharacterized protein LOC127749041 isoform X2 [Frankliniella occidentalis]